MLLPKFLHTLTQHYQLHPLVIFQLLDHVKRRTNEQTRVLGTLLGERVGPNIIIKHAFPVPYDEVSDKVLVDMDYHRQMLSLHQRVHQRHVVVGWYFTGEPFTYISTLIHSVYEKEVAASKIDARPILLTVDVDVSVDKPRMPICAYISSTIAIGDKKLAERFEPADLEIITFEAEKIGVEALINGVPENNDRLDAPATLLGDLDNLEGAFYKLFEDLTTCTDYVQSVVAGDANADIELGEQIATALAAIPHIEPSTFNHIFNTHLQDLLMLVYLASMTHTQVNVSDKVAQLIV